MVAFLGGQDDDMTDAKWEAARRAFWAGDEADDQGQPA